MTDVSQEREYLEQVYIDYLRREYPTIEKFREYATNRFKQDDYSIKDRTDEWPRDVRVCILSNMAFPDIIRLCKTNKKWQTVICSSSYNAFWQSLYFRDFYQYVPVGTVPIPFAENILRSASKKQRVSKKRQAALSTLKTVLWFDLYLYSWSRIRHMFPLAKRTLRTFISAKYRATVLEGFPEIYFTRHTTNSVLPATVFPDSILSIACCTDRTITPNNLALQTLNRSLSSYVDGVVKLSAYVYSIPDEYIGKSLEVVFKPESVLFKILSDTKSKWNNSERFKVQKNFFIYTLQGLLAEIITPPISEIRKIQWEYFFTELSAQ